MVLVTLGRQMPSGKLAFATKRVNLMAVSMRAALAPSPTPHKAWEKFDQKEGSSSDEHLYCITSTCNQVFKLQEVGSIIHRESYERHCAHSGTITTSTHVALFMLTSRHVELKTLKFKHPTFTEYSSFTSIHCQC